MNTQKLILLMLSIVFCIHAKAQLSGTITVGALNPTYPTVSVAIDSLNLHGVAVGGVIFEVASGHTETILNKVITTNTSGPLNPVTFIKSGLGANPTLNAGAGVSTTVDFIIGIVGSDNITFNGINLFDPTTNTTNTTRMEFGYAILKQNGTNGCQNITITNCTITLQKANTASNGIRIGNHTNINTTSITVSNANGIHKNINITNNNISNVYNGIFQIGSTTVIYYDEDLIFSNNTITNFGGGATIAYGIYSQNYKNIAVENDSIVGGNQTTTTFYGIFTTTATGANVLVNNNFVRLNNTGTTNAWYPIWNSGGTTGGTVTISNNRVDSCFSTTTTTGLFYGIYNGANAATVNIFNNTVNNYIATSTSGTTAFIYNVSGVNNNIYNNLITNNTVNSTSSRILYGIWSNGSIVNTYGNRVINNTRNGGTGTTTSGIYVSGGTLQSIYGNIISNLNATGLSSATVNGIHIAGGTTFTIHNNLVNQLTSPINAGNNGVNGIHISSTSSLLSALIAHNTIHINPTSTGANFGSNGVFVQTGPTIELSNNIIINLGTSLGTGRNVAYRRSTATHATYHPNSNNNLFFAGTPSANNLIFSDNTNNLQTIAAYRNYFQLFLPVRDAESVSENVTFLSLVNSSADFLRVNPATPNQIESGGRIIPNILSDFNNPTARVSFPLVGQINGGGNFPDIGAYEQDMQISDIEGPSITFNAFRNGSTFATNRILANVNIRDKSGIDTSALFGPKVYYRKNANANTLASTNDNLTDGWKFATPLNSSSPYNFSIDYNNLFGGPPTINDTIYYFVIAQDRQVVPNVNASIGTVFGAPLTSSSLSFSNFPISGSSFYVIDTALMPTYTVGATGADFTSFTRTDGFFNFVNNGVLTGPVTVNVIADITNENGAISLNPLSIDATNPDTAIITIKSTSGTRIVSGSITTGGLFKFNNTSNVVIDGSDIMGTPNNLIFNNTATSGANAVFAFIGTNNSEGCRNITLANSIIYNGNRINTSSTVIFIGGATVTSSNTTGGYFNNKIRIINNTIYRAYSGIQVIHHPLSFADSITILDNIIGSDTANNTFSGAGLRLNGMTNSLIKSNNIFNVTNNTTLSTSLYGLWITGNFFNSTIDANHIDRISYTGTQYNQTRGMSITASINANVTISNNQIKRIFSSGADFNVFYGPAGIYFDGTGNNYNIVNNTIHLTGDRPLNTFVYYSYTYNLANAYSAALALNTSALTGVNLHNNILSNTQTASNTASPGFNFALFASNSAIFSNISHNVYWASSTNAGMTNGFFVGGTQTTFAAYRTAMPTDRYSQFIRVPFINDTTLLINTTDSAAWNLFGRAMPLSYLANDFYDSSISTSIASGPNCIGAIKFSEPISVAPVAIASAIPAPNTTTFYFNGGDTIAAITWGSSSFVPVDFRLRYYPGKMPANPHASARYLAAQWDLEGIPVTGFDYSLRLYYNPIHLFNISNQSS